MLNIKHKKEERNLQMKNMHFATGNTFKNTTQVKQRNNQAQQRGESKKRLTYDIYI